MGEEKRYYWIKLQEDFYDDDTIQWIEEQENGEAYVNFYLKLLLKSLKDDGHLIRVIGKRLMPYDVKSLSRLTRTDPDTVRVAMELFKQLGLVELLDSGEIYMSQIDEMIGSETQAAKRMRKMRAKQALELEPLNTKAPLGECNNVTKERNNVHNCYTDIDIDIDKDIENRDIYSPAEQDDVEKIPYKEIISYLNEKAKRQYKSNSKKTRTLIKARYNDGFNLDDFKTVIDNKVRDWTGTEYEKFLRPETLFGTKFEGYLNEQYIRRGSNETQNKRNYTSGIDDDDTDALFEEFERISSS